MARERAGRARRRLLGGYAPLAVGVVLAITLAVVVPSRVPDEVFGATDVAVAEVPDGQAASGWGDSVTPCPDREQQAEGYSYSPPCFEFSGSNGGATTAGVTGDEIRVSFRLTAEGDVISLLAELGGLPLDETTSDLERTAEGLLEYFNQHYQLYGRQFVLEGFQGRGALLGELFGGGQEAATNDALRVSEEIGAFADVTAFTQPYADALTRNDVMAFGAPYMSRQWFNDRRPYAWSSVPGCSVVTEMASEYGIKRVYGRPAIHAGGELRGQPRKVAIVAPNNLEYQQCVDVGVELAGEAGHELHTYDYVLDLAQTQAQAPNLLAKLKEDGITSVAFAGDPMMLTALATEASQQDYQPEWMILGTGFTDLDLAGQLIHAAAPDQWSRAFGGSPSAALPPPTGGDGYRAYTSVRDDEPSLLVEVVYQQLLPLALGAHMAGPELTPETFETGLFAYPERTGTAGTWNWSPEHYTPVVDIREIWWDPEAISPMTGTPGTYVDDGERYQRGEIPEGQPEAPE